MCGICGFVTTDPSRALSEQALLAMRESLAHRGPDDAGIHREELCGFAHRRLSIVDIAGGRQPMSNEDGSVWIVHNGEIYNHAEQRPALVAAGHHFSTRSDTEALIHLYEQHGEELVHRLRGMFAFAIWDSSARRLLLARDRLGIKPLYYTLDGGRLIFASEIKALLASGEIQPQLNYDALPEFMAFGYNTGETTLYRGVKKLPPGHRLVWQNGNITLEQYWDLAFPAEPLAISENEAVERFTELLTESVRLRLMSDVPLGVFLSGGIDSSAIAAITAKLAGKQITTFSVGFEERDYSEFHYARQVAESIDAEHHEITIKPSDFFENLPMLIRHEDEPIRWPSSVPLYFLSKLAGEHVKVVLTGEGSDELLGGYPKYWAGMQNTRFANTFGLLVPQPLRRLLAGKVWGLPVSMKLRKLLSHSFLCRSSKPEDLLFDNFYGIFNRDLQSSLFAPGVKSQVAQVDPWAATLSYFNNGSARSLLDRMLYADIKSYLVELLMKQDQMSMAASIESRVPFLDHELAEFCAALPINMRLRGKTGKYILRKAMKGVLPESVLTRGKMGFPVPLRVWFADTFNSSAREILTDKSACSRELFEPAKVNAILDEHLAGRRDFNEQIWLMLNIELWLKEFGVSCSV